MQQLVLDFEESGYARLLEALKSFDFVRNVRLVTARGLAPNGAEPYLVSIEPSQYKSDLDEASGAILPNSDWNAPLAPINQSMPGLSYWGVPPEDLHKYPAGFGGAKGMFILSPDFDEPLEELHEYMY